MLLSAISSGMSIQQILYAIIVRIPAVLLALSVHEAAHGWMAYKLGDPTAKMMGRVTLNPVKHLDPIGTLSMLLLGFGWAKPVPFNPHNFKKFRSGSALVALAGPVSNFLMAIVGYIVYLSMMIILQQNPAIMQSNFSIAYQALFNMAEMFFALNISLGVFNLIPIPPLDGSKVLFSFLPAKAYNFILNFERYGLFILFIVLVTGVLDVPIGYLMNGAAKVITTPIIWLFGFFSGLFG